VRDMSSGLPAAPFQRAGADLPVERVMRAEYTHHFRDRVVNVLAAQGAHCLSVPALQDIWVGSYQNVLVE
jgi:hypothetical protein